MSQSPEAGPRLTPSTRLPAKALLAAGVSAAMIAQQVAGKAARDASFLVSFNVTKLPGMMMASAALSLVAVVAFSRWMTKYTPARVVPSSFALSAVAFLGEWAVAFVSPRVSAVVLYLHTALFGAAMISAFWALINELFDPHTSKRAVRWIAGGGTFGGVIGAVLAWRAATLFPVSTMLLLLAVGSGFCFWASLRLGAGRPHLSIPPVGLPDNGQTSPFRELRSAPYLRNLALLVGLGAITSGLLDYVFSAQAAARYENGADLLRFFSLFGLAVGVLSFLLQMTLGRIALERLGIAVTLALLPGVVVLGGAFGLAVPGLLSTSILRGAESTQRNSLFRAAYELLYTPLAEQKKRSTKILIDVGFDRAGTFVASGLVLLALAFDGAGDKHHARTSVVLLVVAIALALFAVTRSRSLHKGYISVLEESLRQETQRAAEHAPHARISTADNLELRDEVIEHLEALKEQNIPELPGAATVVVEPTGESALQAMEASLRAARELCSADLSVARRALKEGDLTPPLVGFVIPLLAHKELHHEALASLRAAADRATGQLCDALTDPKNPFQVRRRVPRALAASTSEVAVLGLLAGTRDVRFEVRYECGRALLKHRARGASVPLDTVIELVKHETEISKEVWDSQPPLEVEDDDEEPTLTDRLLRDRLDRSLEHIFTLLALHIDQESLRHAFKALHAEDTRLRGTALEYLETVLPDAVREAVWPVLGEERPMRAPRPVKEILADLESVQQPGDRPADVVIGTISAAPPMR